MAIVVSEGIVRQKATKYYAVRNGKVPGVYTDVEEYRAQVDGFSGYVARVFADEREAKNFVAGKITDTEFREERSRRLRGIACPLSEQNQNNWDLRWRAAQTVAAYVDGSHNDETNKCGYGVVITTGDGREILLYGIDKDASKTGLRSVASEIAGCMAAIEWAQTHQVKKLIIVSDCAATIELATQGRPQTNEFMRQFVYFYNKVLRSKKMEITFRKIDGHIGNKYGDLSDALARYALGKDIKYSQKQVINKIGPINWETKRPKEKKKKKKVQLRKEIYDNWSKSSSVYRIDFSKNKIVRGNILSVYKDGTMISKITAAFQGVFLDIERKEFGKTVFMHRENAEQKLIELNNS